VGFFSSIWNIIGIFFWTFAFIAYLFALFAVIGDLFRDRELKGGFKALWIIFLVFVPFLTVLAYMIFRGRGMAERQAQNVRQAQNATEDYIKTVAGTSPADEIAKAKTLLDSGAISAQEFEALKARVLASA
jgi:tellurite resistance protein TehA-like permease